MRQQSAYTNAIKWQQKYGHGWVRKRENGTREVCGGASLCPTCRYEMIILELIDEYETLLHKLIPRISDEANDSTHRKQ